VSRHYWPVPTWSTPADSLCLYQAPSPNADHYCIRPQGHPGGHRFTYSPDIRDYSHRERAADPKSGEHQQNDARAEDQ
jgi:hypothetical protein